MVRKLLVRILLGVVGLILGGAVGGIAGWLVGYRWRGSDFVYDQSEDVILPLFCAVISGFVGGVAGFAAGMGLSSVIERRLSAA